MLTDTQRSAIVTEALSWLGTPYQHGACVKGAGVDCLMLAHAAYTDSGVCAPAVIPKYPPDWHLHRSEERYLEGLGQYFSETKDPQPGDLVMYKFGRCVSHAAIVTKWPEVVHAYLPDGVVSLTTALAEPLGSRLHSILTFTGVSLDEGAK